MPWSVTHIIVAGTSVLRNAGRSVGGEAGKVLAGCGTARPLSEADRVCAEHARPSSSIYMEALNYLRQNPCEASAEINAMAPWLGICGRGDGAPSRVDRVVLLHTDTGAGLLAARLLAHYLRELLGSRVEEPRRIDGFGVPETMARGLINLARAVKEEAYKSDIALLNVTGGFKPESGYALLAGLRHTKVLAAYYIHEAFRDTIIIPLSLSTPKPVTMGEDLVPVSGVEDLEKLAYALEPTGLSRYARGEDEKPSIAANILALDYELKIQVLGPQRE